MGDWCAECVEACFYEALVRYGKRMTVEEVFDQVRRDKIFYDSSGGGVTVSGGEPLTHGDFVAELFNLCRGDIAKAYFRLLPLSGKKEYEDHDDNGNVNSVTLCLQFGEYGEVETPRRDAFEAAQPGDPYYVAFYSETDRAFACFAAEAFEPDGSFQIRQ